MNACFPSPSDLLPRPQKCKWHCHGKPALCFPKETMNLPQEQTFPRRERCVHLEEIHGRQQAIVNLEKKKKIPKSSSPMGNTVCIAALKCWTNTNQSHSSLQSGRCNSVIQSWVQGGWVYWAVTVCSRPKAARTVDYADCTSQTLMCTWITRGSFKSRFGFSWSGVGPETPHS